MPPAVKRRTYLVECFWPGVDEGKFGLALGRAQEAAHQLRREGQDVEFRGSILVYADETVFWLFEGCESAVRAASEWAGLSFERVLEARIDGTGQMTREA
jgi:thioesterase domain-containing protein